MNRVLFIFAVLVAAGIGGVAGALLTVKYLTPENSTYPTITARQTSLLGPVDSVSNTPTPFGKVSGEATKAVVHISTSYGPGNFSSPTIDSFFGQQGRSSGSGVILTDDGYIVTNNHVVEDASSIEVVLNDNRRYFAKVIGTDPTTDLALLKIRARELPFLPFGNSDAVAPGEWVLAIGNPFELNSTVTAGIVSAKARNIGILASNNPLRVESFIQTDAAVNPGNSGGALVNLTGELIGINTAIATSNGSYQGYSFAIPVSLVRKVVDDLKEFGQVQRGLLGIQIADVDAAIAEDLGLAINQGVLVNRVNQQSAAQLAGIERGDVIIAIDNKPIHSVSELQEWVARNRPGKKIGVTYLRDGKELKVLATLRNDEGTENLVANESDVELTELTLEKPSFEILQDLKLEGGVVISALKPGKWYDAGIRSGFVLAYIDKVPVDNEADLHRILKMKSGAILVEGFYLTGKKASYAVDW